MLSVSTSWHQTLQTVTISVKFSVPICVSDCKIAVNPDRDVLVVEMLPPPNTSEKQNHKAKKTTQWIWYLSHRVHTIQTIVLDSCLMEIKMDKTELGMWKRLESLRKDRADDLDNQTFELLHIVDLPRLKRLKYVDPDTYASKQEQQHLQSHQSSSHGQSNLLSIAKSAFSYITGTSDPNQKEQPHRNLNQPMEA